MSKVQPRKITETALAMMTSLSTNAPVRTRIAPIATSQRVRFEPASGRSPFDRTASEGGGAVGALDMGPPFDERSSAVGQSPAG